MDKFKLNRTFKRIKKEAKLDYAITTPDKYGDCNTCVSCELADVFGIDSTGIYAKHWVTGMNKGGAWKNVKEVYIGHDVTEAQADIIIRVLKEEGYTIFPEKYDTREAFLISEKEI